MNFNYILVAFAYLALTLRREGVEGAKILAIFPFPGPSQSIVVQPYFKALAARGHEVTVIGAFPQKTAIKNLRDIEVPEVRKYVGDVLSFASTKVSMFQIIMGFSWYYSMICQDVLQNEEVQKLLNSKKEHFDVVIVETLQTDVLFGFADHFNASLIGFSSYGSDPYIDAFVHNLSPLAYTPLHIGTMTERMDFGQRLENMWHNLLIFLHRIFVLYPMQNSLYNKYFPNAQRPLAELRQNFSLILLNQHFSLSYPRPYVTNMIEVGGFHIQHDPQPLPQEIRDFIGNSEAIYFSMGSNIKSEHFPLPVREMFLQVFARLPYKVLWKFENPSLLANGIPANVFVQKWFPQADILAHPQLKLFITHGGLLSLTETLHHGKPILGIPICFDQILNMKKAQQYGYGLALDYFQLNETVLMKGIMEIMRNPQYAAKAAEMSLRYRDQPMDPLEKAIYWTEYILRHKGAEFLGSPARFLNIFQRNSWDCAAVLGGAIVMVFFMIGVIIFFIKKAISRMWRKKEGKEKIN